MKRPAPTAVLGLGGLLLAIAAQAQPATPAAPVDGQRAYQMHCSHCHAAGPGRAGTAALERRLGKSQAVLESRGDLQAPYVQHVVRFGLNAMLPLRRTEVSTAELDAITAWLTRPRDAAAETAPGLQGRP